MNEAELTIRLSEGGLKLSFDTNALFPHNKLFKVCDDVSRWNAQLTSQGHPPVHLVVCTVAHAEKLFDLKQRFHGSFDRSVILSALQSKGLEIEPFNVEHAFELAERLGEFYPDTDTWRQAKRERCLRCLGLDPNTSHVPGTGKHCGATVDWLIGVHARAGGCVLVSDDTGLELKQLERVRLDTLATALQRLVRAPA